MRTRTEPNGLADEHVKEIKRKTRRKFSAEEKIRIVLDGLRGEKLISELCRREEIAGVIREMVTPRILEVAGWRMPMTRSAS